MSDWPVRWSEPHWKTPISKKVVRGLKRMSAEDAVDKQKMEVRVRDKYCRFPLCGCRKFKLLCHVSHQVHRGMGGNPKGDRSDPALMIYVCSARHKENAASIDRGMVRWRALTPKGANGPVAWDVEARVLKPRAHSKWIEVAREVSFHVYEPFTPQQQAILARLAEMTL